jgi:signal transduction histidine kinase
MKTTVRLRLTALYGGLFLLGGVALLAVTYVLTARRLAEQPFSPLQPKVQLPAGMPSFVVDMIQRARKQQTDQALHELLVQSAIALAIVVVIALVLGWLVAGRVLRPLREITTTAHRLSTRNLNERINLRGPHDELKELADTIDAMLDRISTAFEAQRRFVANASHELRTPLTVQRAALDVALADPEPTVSALRTMGQRIRTATEAQEHLIGGLLTLARSEQGIEQYERVDLAEVAHEAIAALDHHGLRISSRLGQAQLYGDATLIERLAVNLVENAARHNGENGWIDIETGWADGAASLRVANSGPRVPPGQVPLLFEPFRRHPAGRTADGTGHGLGLSIVAAIVAAHHGRYDAAARPDGGLDIVVSLPG